MYYPALALIVISNVLYHLSQKMTPSGVNPVVSLIIAYSVSILVLLPMFFIFPMKDGLSESVSKLNWASVLLGVAVVGVEFGFLLAYRMGSNISSTQFYATTILTIILIPLGVFIFREKLTPVNVAGIVLCVVGVLLIQQKS
ncbi:MAG: EamA family transporter [Spirochaetota bacterium]